MRRFDPVHVMRSEFDFADRDPFFDPLISDVDMFDEGGGRQGNHVFGFGEG